MLQAVAPGPLAAAVMTSGTRPGPRRADDKLLRLRTLADGTRSIRNPFMVGRLQ